MFFFFSFVVTTNLSADKTPLSKLHSILINVRAMKIYPYFGGKYLNILDPKIHSTCTADLYFVHQMELCTANYDRLLVLSVN